MIKSSLLPFLMSPALLLILKLHICIFWAIEEMVLFIQQMSSYSKPGAVLSKGIQRYVRLK